jgi:hypothetical protein
MPPEGDGSITTKPRRKESESAAADDGRETAVDRGAYGDSREADWNTGMRSGRPPYGP